MIFKRNTSNITKLDDIKFCKVDTVVGYLRGENDENSTVEFADCEIFELLSRPMQLDSDDIRGIYDLENKRLLIRWDSLERFPVEKLNCFKELKELRLEQDYVEISQIPRKEQLINKKCFSDAI